MTKLGIGAVLILGFTVSGWCQQSAEPSAQPCCSGLQQQMKAMEDRIILLEGQVRILKEQLAKTQSSQQQAPGAVPTGASNVPAPSVPAAGTQATVAAPGAGQPSTQLPVYGGASALAKALNPDVSAIGDFTAWFCPTG